MSRMTRAEKLAGVKDLAPWFHCIDIGDGVLTKSVSLAGEPEDNPRPTWNVIRRFLPNDLSGQEVLDVGCNAGFYAIEAKRRGAKRVLGVDALRGQVRQAQFARRALDLDIEYRRGSVYDLCVGSFGRFDVTLALGLIYHLKHPMLALENLASVTRHLMILETEVYPPDRKTKPFHLVHGDNDQRVHTLGYVENAPEAFDVPCNWFLPSVECLPALIRCGGFDEIEVVDVRGARAVCVCRKSREAPDSSSRPNHLRHRLALDRDRVSCGPGDPIHFRVRLENTGLATWLAAGEGRSEKGSVRLGGHLCREEIELERDYGRADLPGDVRAGETVEIDIEMRAPEQPGTYQIDFDLVDEHIAWFEDLGSPIASATLSVA